MRSYESTPWYCGTWSDTQGPTHKAKIRYDERGGETWVLRDTAHLEPAAVMSIHENVGTIYETTRQKHLCARPYARFPSPILFPPVLNSPEAYSAEFDLFQFD